VPEKLGVLRVLLLITLAFALFGLLALRYFFLHGLGLAFLRLLLVVNFLVILGKLVCLRDMLNLLVFLIFPLSLILARDGLESFVDIFLKNLSNVIFDVCEDAIEEEFVNQRHGSVVCDLDEYASSLGPSHPVRELLVVGSGCRKHHDSYMVRQHHNGLFPHCASFLIVDVVNLVEDNPLDLLDRVRVVVEHLLEDLSSADDA